MRPTRLLPMLDSACLPANTVGTDKIEPYKRTSPRRRSTQYQKSRASNAPSERIKGRMLGEKRRVGLGAVCDHCESHEFYPVTSMKLSERTYHAHQHQPWREDQTCRYGRDKFRRELVCRAESVLDLGERVIPLFDRVCWRRLGTRKNKIEELNRYGVV